MRLNRMLDDIHWSDQAQRLAKFLNPVGFFPGDAARIGGGAGDPRALADAAHLQAADAVPHTKP